MRRRRLVSQIVTFLALARAAAAQGGAGDGGADWQWWVSFGVFVLFVLVAVGCLFWAVGWYGNYVHVHRNYYRKYDADGRLLAFGYQTTFDGDMPLPSSVVVTAPAGSTLAGDGGRYARASPPSSAAAALSPSAEPSLRTIAASTRSRALARAATDATTRARRARHF